MVLFCFQIFLVTKNKRNKFVHTCTLWVCRNTKCYGLSQLLIHGVNPTEDMTDSDYEQSPRKKLAGQPGNGFFGPTLQKSML